MTDSNAPSGSTTSRDGRDCSAFQRALRQFINNLPEKSKKGALIQACTSGGNAVTAESINECIRRVEERRTSRHKIEKFLSPVVRVLRAYDGVINSLVSVDPMPTALIWGALKVVIDGVDRFTSLFETIRTELVTLTVQITHINEYEDLYGKSEEMQNILCKSYINMFRFWHQVDKECGRCRAIVFSFRNTKLQKIIDNLQSNVDHIKEQGSIIEARRAEDERQRGRVEASKADQGRIETRHSFQEVRAEQQKERRDYYYSATQSWIGLQEWNEANNCIRHRNNLNARQRGTCDWLARHSVYSGWQNGITNPSIFWLHSPPGFGKTFLCSHALQLIKDSDPHVAVTYHFYREEHHTGCETLRILAGQLLECYGKHSTQVDEKLYLQTQRRTCSLENIQELITILVESLPRTYFFIDGLDQEVSPHSRWTEALTVLDFLVRLSMKSPDKVRIWCSSQSQPCIREKLKDVIMFDIKDQLGVRDDVTLYLSRVMSRYYPELDQEADEKDRLLEHLQKRVDGNFLFASLMIDDLEEEAGSLTDLQEFIKQGDLPKTWDDFYRKKFEKIAPPMRRLAYNVFALVAFARRPLRVKELREAVGLLQSKTPHSPKAADMPLIRRLRQLFSPMIEVQIGGSDHDLDDSPCRLFHSTVGNFLMKNSDVLGHNLPITRRIIADACLGYLSQSRYAELLTVSGGEWCDIRGENMDQHQFLLYAAKYWDKHLDHVPESEELHRHVQTFITSSNFQTCIQVQSLGVEHKFAVFGRYGDEDNQAYPLRVFPQWFTKDQSIPSKQGAKLCRDYHRFVHDWRHLLAGEVGEIDRCWWAALGPRNFLSRWHGRYTSFIYQADEDAHHGSWQDYDGVSMSSDQLKRLRLHSRYNDSLEFICEHWSLPVGDRAPILEKKQTISAHAKATNWFLYSKYSGDESTLRIGAAAPAMFSPDCRFLRIGAQLFALDDQGTYVAMPGPHVESEPYPADVEVFAFSQRYAVVTRRRNTKNTNQRATRDRKNNDFNKRIKEETNSVAPVSEGGDDEESSADSESDFSYASSVDSADRAYETWSECSTEYEDDFEDDVIAPWTVPVDGDSSDSSGLESEGNMSDADQSEEPGSESVSEDADFPTSAVVGYGHWHSDDEDYDLEGEGTHHQIRLARRPWTRGPRDPQVSLTVFNTECSPPSRIFYFSYKVSSMIFASPPVVHPSEPLVVWPLGGGEVLFADFVANTYFLRKLRPSTRYTKHVFMKCHFSSCGLYLHMASLEVQRKPASTSQRNAERDPLKIALLVSTYRICGHKTTKSPPTLIHRVKVHMGFAKSLSVSELPYTLTWMPTELYFTCSSKVLRVYRIRLFKNPDRLDKTWGEHDVLMPKRTIFLPGTASQRKVYYFPPVVGSTKARVIVGSEVRAYDVEMDENLFGGQHDNIPRGVPEQVDALGVDLSPPIGCYLDETDDFGGWANSNNCLDIPEALGIGKLDRRRERFDYEDDCDCSSSNLDDPTPSFKPVTAWICSK
ncbi:hypothetical protein JB92DRAFT_3104133 [Gautieria morchelliformis]|nr:hypothetical protein JB92DRAFT_3104133 [Gautieria morchelliformis]